MPRDVDVHVGQIAVDLQEVEGVRGSVPVAVVGVGFADLPLCVEVAVAVAVPEGLYVIGFAFGKLHGVETGAVG